MNTDIRLSVGFWSHPKTKKTARRLGLEGVRSLQILWLWAAVNRADGHLSGMDWEDIELAADWQGEEHAFFDVCLGVWIDQTEEGYSLHDWQDHNSWASEAEDRSGQSRLAKLAQVNRAAYDDCLSRGVTGLTADEYRMMKRFSGSNSDRTAPQLRPQSAPTATAERPLANGTGPAPSPSPIQEEEKTLSTHESLVNQDYARALNVAGGETGEGFTPKEVRDGAGDEPSIEFAELREFWDRECRAEGPLTGWQEYKQLKAARQWPGMGRIAQDVAERYASGAWEKGWAKALGNYLRERYWLAEAKAGPKKQPRASPRAPTEHQRRLTEREGRAQKLLELRGMKPQGEDHEHAEHHCGQAVDVEHRVRDIAL